jgi:hypothetical protein
MKFLAAIAVIFYLYVLLRPLLDAPNINITTQALSDLVLHWHQSY